MNYYPFHMGDYATATRHLSWDEDAAYRRLLDAYYTTEKPLPVELRAVFRLVVATTEAQRDAVEIVLREFFVLTDEGWLNKRAEVELNAMREKQQKQRDKANRRWDMQRTERGNATAQTTDAAASEAHADAMPPTPTPTPTPKEIKTREPARKRAAVLPKPDGVAESVWTDWVALRRAKGSPVTATVIDGASDEARKAGMSLDEFLRVWCLRGSQGLQADWLRPSERSRAPPEAAWRTEQRTRVAAFAGPYAAKPEMESINVIARLVD